MKNLIALFAIISSSALAQQVKPEKDPNHILSPKEQKAVQNKIIMPAGVSTISKDSAAVKKSATDSPPTVTPTSKPEVAKKVVKKKHKKIVKKETQ